jgi:AraC-like DNA-binding protein
MNLSEIAFMLNYSSVAHLSNQFKKVTGFSPSYYKSIKENKRMQIEDV